MRQYNSLDKSFEAYLARIAGDTIDNQTVKAAPVRVHYQSKETGIWVPLGQSVISGLLIALAVLISGLAVGWSQVWILALVVWAVGSLVMWFYSIWDWRRLIHRLEDFTGKDIDKDFHVGEPESCHIEVSENGGRSVKFIDLPVSLDRLAILAEGLLKGVSFSEANWVGSDNLFNRGEFNLIRKTFIDRGIFEWNSPGTAARGVKMTRSGRAVMRYLAGVEESPSPTEGENP